MMHRIQPHPQKRVAVNGHEMAYVTMGTGAPIVFLHGNPTSSYLWRNVMPQVCSLGRCIAPDLIGMGNSDKLPNPGPDTYRFQTHQQYLEGFMEALDINENVILVIHDWGSALGFDWARRHSEKVAGIAYMEGFSKPLTGWGQFSKEAAPLFQAFRSEAGEEIILDKNVFIEKVLPSSILRTLKPEEMAEYRKPFSTREDRWPTLTWPREIPVGGDPADVHEVVTAFSEWFGPSDLPKLFVNAEPGAIMTGAVRDFCRTFKNQTEVTVRGSHFIQEDSGPEIGTAVAKWILEHVRA
ncbi:MAG: haloalkane dehalogenase [Pseudomonadota bacterium]